tara:strand:- start:19868 stop:21076 length:1209 start_codon:yes stop_codon:yes gene_type:complete
MVKVAYYTHNNTNLSSSVTNHSKELVKGISHGMEIFLIDSNYKYKRFYKGKSNEYSYPFYINKYLSFLVIIFKQLFNLFKFGPLQERGLLSNIFDISKLFKSLYVCKKNKIDILITPNPNNIPFLKLSCKILGIPLIFEEFNVEFERVKDFFGKSYFSRILKKVELWSCSVSDLVFTVSEIDRDKLLSYGVKRDKVVTISNSADFSKFSSISESKIKLLKKDYNLVGKKILIMHGDWEYKPNKISFEIFKKWLHPKLLNHYGDSLIYLILGKAIPKIDLKNMLKLGWIEDLANHLAMADIAILPLLSGGGTRNKVLDYLAVGVPIVSTTKGIEGINLKDGKDVIISNDFSSKFVEQIKFILDNQDKAVEIGKNGKEKCIEEYSLSNISKKAIDNIQLTVSKY